MKLRQSLVELQEVLFSDAEGNPEAVKVALRPMSTRDALKLGPALEAAYMDNESLPVELLVESWLATVVDIQAPNIDKFRPEAMGDYIDLFALSEVKVVMQSIISHMNLPAAEKKTSA